MELIICELGFFITGKVEEVLCYLREIEGQYMTVKDLIEANKIEQPQ